MKSICKSLRIKERQLRNKRRKPRKPLQPVWYRVDPDDPSMLILRNGRRLKQLPGVDLYVSKIGEVYSLTRYGLRQLRVDYHPKRRYGMKSCNGINNGRRYPYVKFRRKDYTVHLIMVDIWLRPRKDGEEVDHLDGNIHNFRLDNLDIVTPAENQRRGRILRAMRKAAQDLDDPSLAPENKSPEELRRIFKEIDCDDATAIMEWEMCHHMEI